MPIIKKIKNQINKLKGLYHKYKLEHFKKSLKSCGENVFIQQPVRLEGMEHISIGNNVSINAFVHMWGHGTINIGDDCLIASHVSINSVTHNSEILPYKNNIVTKEVNIGNNVWIGSHSVILPGIKIGNNAIIGAGSIVNKDVPPNVTVAGVPAKIIKSHK